MGFLGMGNYAKPGKGVRKNEAEKKRIFVFFELFGRKFFKLIQLNLLYLLFCIPIITIGPATAAMMKIARCYVEEKPVFLFSDYLDAFKANFKQGWLIGIIDIICYFLIGWAFFFYYLQANGKNKIFWVPLIIVGSMTIIFVLMHFYIYLLMSSVNLKGIQILKNSFMFAFLGMKTNIFTLIFTGIIMVPCILFFPYSFPVLLLLTFSLVSLIISFNSFQYIYKYTIRPYYLMTGEKDPYEVEDEDETIFEDENFE